MDFYVLRKGEPPWRGPFSESSLRAGLATGRVKPSDLCWSRESGEWRPVAERFAPSDVAHQTPRSEPSAAALLARVMAGVLLIFGSFGALHLLSTDARRPRAPYAASEAIPIDGSIDISGPDEENLFDDLDDVQPSQPAESSGALPPEDPQLNHA